MSRRMSCSMTIDAVRNRTKTVTRRHPDTWKALQPGDRLTLIEKGMGLPKGAKQVVLAEVEVVDVRVEKLDAVWDEPRGTALEGLGHMTAEEFCDLWRRSHSHSAVCRRIEWRYLDQDSPGDRGDNGQSAGFHSVRDPSGPGVRSQGPTSKVQPRGGGAA